jgi:hypothetical protein
MTGRLVCLAVVSSILTCACAARLPRDFEQAATTADQQAAREDVRLWAIHMDWDWSSLVSSCAGEQGNAPGLADLVVVIGPDGALQAAYVKEEDSFGTCLRRGVESFGPLPAPPVAPLFTRVVIRPR